MQHRIHPFQFRAIACGVLGVLAGASLSLAEPAPVWAAPEQPAEASAAPAPQPAGQDVLNMDLEQLTQADVKVAAPALEEVVSSVSRQESTVGKSPAAVFVITPEMIRHSGANNIPDLLRMVPGIEVARIDANKWAITSRGFNNLYASKLLVQIDGRAVYSQFFSGVIWSHQDVVLQDVERIEVIRGPGATVWGANAVNGVINIITKQAKDTQGVLVHGGTGTEERGFSTVRYGGQIGENLHWRAYGKQFERDGGYLFGPEADDWRQARGGFRSDWTPTNEDTFTVQGDFFDGDSGEAKSVLSPTSPFLADRAYDNHDFGQNCLMRWTHVLDDDSDWSIQTYYDRYGRISPVMDLEQETFDVDLQYRFPLGERHNVICGAGYRHIDDRFLGNLNIAFDPATRNTNLFSYFLQDEITLEEDLWYFIAGSKFEHNDFTGFEYQPSIRLLYTPTERQTAWAAVSRAVRTPSRVEHDLLFHRLESPTGPVLSRVSGNDNVESEDLLAVEFGYRAQPVREFSWDLALFWNDYTDLAVTGLPGAPFFDPAIPAIIVPVTYENSLLADTYGAELSSTLQLRRDWLLTGSYSLLYLDIHDVEATNTMQGSSPHNQAYLRSSWQLRSDLDFDLIGRYVDNLASLGVSSYLTADARLAWRPIENLEWAVVGRNLLDDRHAEFVDRLSGVHGTEVQHEIFTTLTWKR
ncbi:MAG TPA: TonB-dependent receptor [Lacipirellula sp.]